jgi:hypothetical protein
MCFGAEADNCIADACPSFRILILSGLPDMPLATMFPALTGNELSAFRFNVSFVAWLGVCCGSVAASSAVLFDRSTTSTTVFLVLLYTD